MSLDIFLHQGLHDSDQVKDVSDLRKNSEGDGTGRERQEGKKRVEGQGDRDGGCFMP